MTLPQQCDVLIVGAGNAGLCAAISAATAGAKRVVMVDKCPETWAGGNSYFTAGAYRTVHGGLSDLLPIVNNVDEQLARRIDLEPYTEKDFADDMNKSCEGRSDPALSNVLVQDSNATVKWLASLGVRYQLAFNRQAYEVDGRLKFWGGLHLKTEDGGKGLIHDLLKAACKCGISIFWSTPLVGIDLADMESRRLSIQAIVQNEGLRYTIDAKAVILAAGGFEASREKRAQYLGPGWDVAKVRGTPYNTGDCLQIATAQAAAASTGNWSGCHSVAWDAHASGQAGDREASNEYTKSGYPLGLMLNVNGERFVDEGEDLRNYTYAKFGRAILSQPDSIAFQVWDARTTPWLRTEEYREERVKRITAATVEELALKCKDHGLDNSYQFLATLKEYNAAVYAHRLENPDMAWNPAIRDGFSTQSSVRSLAIPKSNWALPLDKPPFLAVKVSCGITFTFGGLKVDPHTGQVVSKASEALIPGLFCCGEMIGGLFYQNYPGGSGLTSGSVFGRRAGQAAAKLTSPFST